MKNLSCYNAPKQSIWTGRKDSSLSGQPLYYHEKIQIKDLKSTELKSREYKTHALIGYACDIGAYRNQGRPGAKDGPGHIRSALSKMAWHGDKQSHILDLGDITCPDTDMELSQHELSIIVSKCLVQNITPIVLGGSHDMAYGHFCGIHNYLQEGSENKKVGIINIDAHFDLRKTADAGNSGTPFYQIAELCKRANYTFSYLCIGINKFSNTRELYATAEELNTLIIPNTNCNMKNWSQIREQLSSFIKSVDFIYLSVDLDAFSASVAPGVSAPSPLGINPRFALKCMDEVLRSEKLLSVDIAELNPKYDADNITAKLAAAFVNHIIV